MLEDSRQWGGLSGQAVPRWKQLGAGERKEKNVLMGKKKLVNEFYVTKNETHISDNSRNNSEPELFLIVTPRSTTQ